MTSHVAANGISTINADIDNFVMTTLCSNITFDVQLNDFCLKLPCGGVQRAIGKNQPTVLFTVPWCKEASMDGINPVGLALVFEQKIAHRAGDMPLAFRCKVVSMNNDSNCCRLYVTIKGL
ncbi:MAG TPA: hypothetical protein VFM68_02975 [Candidatus Saccharimonadales bacterium]|nr:hypothetical protein [Candidatus Saccharimonadales bacterium]